MIPKFRAWHKAEKYMGFVDIVDYKHGQINIVGADIAKFEEVELMQSTGQKDKNGVELFEGDICKCFNGLKDYWYVVEWVYAGWQTVTFKKPGSSVVGIAHEMNQFYIEPDEAKQLTIVGNIYQNPDLIEVR